MSHHGLIFDRISREIVIRLFSVSVVIFGGAHFAHSADLKVGDTVPNCSKIPLIDLYSEFVPQTFGTNSFENSILSNGVVILHFCSPRPARKSAFETAFIKQLSDLQMAAQSVPYPCTPVAVVPLGEKGKEDANQLIESSEVKPWGKMSGEENPYRKLQLSYEPTYPRPGLYRTFRSIVGDTGSEISTPWTYLIGPDRKVIAMRGPDSTVPLYDWLQQNLPETVTAVPKSPSSNLSLPNPSDWVWPTFRKSAQHQMPASMLPDVLPYTYLAWQARVGRTFSSPAVVDNVVYINSDSEGLRSLTLSTGQNLMGYQYGQSWWSSPVVAGDIVYVVSNAGVLQAVDRGSFRKKWTRELDGLVTSSPTVIDGALYLGSRNGSVYAIDAKNGEVLWTFQTGGEISSSPALANGILVIGSGDRNVYAIDSKSGTLKWTFATEGPVDSSPTIADGSVFVGSFDGSLYSLKLADGVQNWRSQLGGWVHSSPAVDEDRVFVGTVNIRHGSMPTFNWIDRKTGNRVGSFEMPEAVYSSPTIWGDLVLIGCRDRQLYAFDRKMRQTQPAWTYRTRSYVHSTPVVVGDTVLVASFDGNVYALRQAKPIRIWNDNDIVPRWFVAAMSTELHKQLSDLIAKAASGKVGGELSLKPFKDVYGEIRASAAKAAAGQRVLPRDVPAEHPGAPFIEYALTAGLLTGYPDSSFKPNEPTTRYQFSFGLATVFEAVKRPDFAWRILSEKSLRNAQVDVRVTPMAGNPRNMPTDVEQNHWAFDSLTALAEAALNPLDEEGRFRGSKVLTLKDVETQWNMVVATLKVVRAK